MATAQKQVRLSPMALDVETVGLGGVTLAALALVRFVLQKHFDDGKETRAAISENTKMIQQNKEVLIEFKNVLGDIADELKIRKRSREN